MGIPLFDGHCDTITRLHREGGTLKINGLHVDLARAGEFSPYAQFFAIFDSPEFSGGEYCELFDRHYARFLREIQENQDALSFCLCAADAEKAAAQGKAAAFLSVEGAELIGCSIEGLERAHTLGVRAVNITWNNANPLSGSNAEDENRGLTPLGREFVRRAQELGVMVDLSHISEPAFWDVLETAARPVMASHSNSMAVCPHKRNLTDSQFSALVKSGGVAGINLCREFIGKGERVGMAQVVEHIERFMSLGGERAVAIGCDFDGIDRMPDGFEGIQDMTKLYNGLLRMNYSEKLVQDIFYYNMMEAIKCAM